MKKVHFIGIGGSGMSGIALMAHEAGFKISGCDLSLDSSYIQNLKKLNIPLFLGQDAKHIKEADIVAVTPAVFFQNENHPEVVQAKKENKLMTWQQFLGEYLQKDEKVICIAGTHGKSTTTAMVSLLLEKAGMDPSVMIGANIKEWDANYRLGRSKYFVTEADEFFDNFLNYNPEIIILNNIELDHPDYFKTEEQMFESFKRFVEKLKGERTLIYNADDKGVQRLFELIDVDKLSKFNLIGYSINGLDLKLGENDTEFEFLGESYKLKVPGKYNVSNALGVIKLGKILEIKEEIIKQVLFEFKGIGRRLDLLGEQDGIKVYDDYAHHPTAIKATLSALRQKEPKANILAIVEPHTFSRTKALLQLYKDVFQDADEVMIAPIFRSRDNDDFGITGDSIVEVSNHKKIKAYKDFFDIVAFVKQIHDYNVIIVMGAGKSSELAKEILEIV